MCLICNLMAKNFFFFTVDLIGLLINSFFDKSNEERSHCSDGIVDYAVRYLICKKYGETKSRDT